MDAVTAYNEIVYLIKKHALDMTQLEYENWLDSGGLLHWGNKALKNYLKRLSYEDGLALGDWLLEFVNNCKISRKLNKNFKELI